VNVNPVRAVILVVLAVVGVLVIANGFSGTANVTAESSVEPTPTPTPDKNGGQQGGGQQGDGVAGATGSTGGGGGEKKVDLTGVRIQVFNGTATTGLAAQVEQKLVRQIDAQVAGIAGNAEGTEASTKVYYQSPKDQALAEELAAKFFPDAKVAPMSDMPGVSEEVPKDVQVAIVVGEDYGS